VLAARSPAFEYELAAFGQYVPPCLDRPSWRLPREGYEVGHGHGIVQMKFAIRSIVVETIGQIEILLNFDHAQPLADRMDRSGGRIDHVAGPNRLPVQHILDRAVERRSADRIGVIRFAEPECDRRVRFRGQDNPCFVLAPSESARAGRSVIGMDLDRKTIGGEQIFDQQVVRTTARIIIPDLAYGRRIRSGIVEQWREVATAPRFFDRMMGQENRRHDTPIATPHVRGFEPGRMDTLQKPS